MIPEGAVLYRVRKQIGEAIRPHSRPSRWQISMSDYKQMVAEAFDYQAARGEPVFFSVGDGNLSIITSTAENRERCIILATPGLMVANVPVDPFKSRMEQAN